MGLKSTLANWLLGDYRFITINNADGTITDIDFSEHQEQAYFSNAFRACLLAKARPLSTLPVRVNKRVEGVRVEADTEFAKAYADLLRHKWNPFMTGAEGTRWLMMTKDVKGEAFARVSYDWRGIPKAIYPLSGMPMIERTDAGEAVFNYGGDAFTPAGKYLEHEIIWIKSPVLDSDFRGRSLAELAAAELNLSINITEFYSNIINGEAPTSGWLETDQQLSQPAMERVQAQLADGAGVGKAGQIRVFDSGLKYKSTNNSVVDLNMVEQEKWILQETCRTLSVPPQEVYELSNATYSNVEQGALNFANKTLVPECVTIEQGYSSILWLNGYKDTNVQLDMNGLLRGSYKERMEGYRTAIYAGMFSPNVCLAKEDMAPYVGGDYHLLSAAYSIIDPETGEIIPSAAKNNSDPQPGGSGETSEGGRGHKAQNLNPDAMGTALAVIHNDMAQRIRERYEDTGDTPKFRNFAERVLAPFKAAVELEDIPYTIDDDIEEIIK